MIHCKKAKILLAFNLLCAIVVNAQSFVNFTEITDGGRVFKVEPQKDKTGAIKRYPNVDINSSIKIELDKAKIKQEAANWIGKPVAIPFERMDDVSKILSKRKELLEAINLGKDNSLAARKKALNEASISLDELFTMVETDMPNTPLYNKVNNIFASGGSANDSYIQFFDAIEQEIDNIKLTYDSAMAANKVYFRMGAFINNNPVHVENFDIYKEGEFFRVPRFATAIDADEKKKFDDYKALADDANKDIKTAFKRKLKEVIEPIILQLEVNFKTSFTEPLASLNNGIQSVKGITDDIKTKVQERQKELVLIESNIKLLKDIIKNSESENYFNSLETNLNILILNIKRFRGNLESNITDLKTNISVEGQDALKSFIDSYTSGKSIFDSMLNDMQLFFDSQSRLNISIIDKVSESLLKLGNEVKKIPLDNLPDDAKINLLTAGNRKSGDKLYIKAVFGKQPLGSEASEEKTIMFSPIGLYLVGLHSSINAVLLFVDNTSVEYTTKRQFQLDPSYSVLFKWGSRKYSAYNNFVELGGGINMATLDFNNDNIPEIGIGVVGSVFKDVIQAGYGRNMMLDQNYWFLGIRLPFLSVGLTGKPKTVKEE